MPKSSRYSVRPAGELPGALRRAPREALKAFTRAVASAVQKYDQAIRAAYAELKQTFEKCGDHWIPKQAPC